jgi:hypothetical protein
MRRATEHDRQLAVDICDVSAEVFGGHGQRLAGHLDQCLLRGDAGVEEHRDPDHAFAADGGGLHDLVGAQVGDDGDDAHEREVDVLDRLPRLLQHLAGEQRRRSQIGQQRREGGLVQAIEDGVPACGARVGPHVIPPMPCGSSRRTGL